MPAPDPARRWFRPNRTCPSLLVRCNLNDRSRTTLTHSIARRISWRAESLNQWRFTYRTALTVERRDLVRGRFRCFSSASWELAAIARSHLWARSLTRPVHLERQPLRLVTGLTSSTCRPAGRESISGRRL